MTWLSVLKYLLQIAAFVAKKSEKADVEKAILNELEIINGNRVRRADDARNDVVSGRMPVDPNDPFRRD